MTEPLTNIEAKRMWDFYKFRVSASVREAALNAEVFTALNPALSTTRGELLQLEMDDPNTTDLRKTEILRELLTCIRGVYDP